MLLAFSPKLVKPLTSSYDGFVSYRARKLVKHNGKPQMPSRLLTWVGALALTTGSAFITRTGDERAMYGNEGPWEQNWLPREVAGWPAPYLADNPGTSVIHKVGVEDDLRLGPFVATFSFWLVICFAALRLITRSRARDPRG